MRNFIYILMLAGVAALCGSQGSFGASSPPNSAKSQTEPYVYVSGGVHKPGRYDWTKGMTLIDAVQAAGGFKESAGRRVRILHVHGASEIHTRGGTNAAPVLEAGDKISVQTRVW